MAPVPVVPPEYAMLEEVFQMACVKCHKAPWVRDPGWKKINPGEMVPYPCPECGYVNGLRKPARAPIMGVRLVALQPGLKLELEMERYVEGAAVKQAPAPPARPSTPQGSQAPLRAAPGEPTGPLVLKGGKVVDMAGRTIAALPPAPPAAAPAPTAPPAAVETPLPPPAAAPAPGLPPEPAPFKLAAKVPDTIDELEGYRKEAQDALMDGLIGFEEVQAWKVGFYDFWLKHLKGQGKPPAGSQARVLAGAAPKGGV